MNSPRLWIGILTLVVFLAGSASGFLFASATRQETQSSGPNEDYRRAFCARFRLDARRATLFDELLRNYHSDVEDLRQRALASSMSEMEPQLVAVGLRYRDVIRDHVLPENQRAEFDELAKTWTPFP